MYFIILSTFLCSQLSLELLQEDLCKLLLLGFENSGSSPSYRLSTESKVCLFQPSRSPTTPVAHGWHSLFSPGPLLTVVLLLEQLMFLLISGLIVASSYFPCSISTNMWNGKHSVLLVLPLCCICGVKYNCLPPCLQNFPGVV